jgi:tetratricopeptide (TPR) repeat protein
VLQRDHQFWKQFSKRLTGDFIDYDTPIKDITDWIEKVYVRHDFTGFTGDRKFIYDDDGQKAFSKLRSSIGGIYSWRLSQAPPEYQPKDAAERARLVKEAEFTFKQAFAFCPYSPEALYRYVIGLLLPEGRVPDALLLVDACLKLDPYNSQVLQLRDNLRSYQRQQPAAAAPPPPGAPTLTPVSPQQMESDLRTNPSNYQLALQLASIYHQTRQPARAVQLLESVVTNPAAPFGALMQASQMFNAMQDWTNLERSLDRMVAMAPAGAPEAWYNLAAARAILGKNPEALAALSQAIAQSNQRRKTDTNAPDLAAEARKETAFPTLRSMPEYQKLVAPPQP